MWQRVLGGLGLALLCTYVAFHYLMTGLLAPIPATVAMLVVWCAFLAGAIVLYRCRPAWVLAVPFVAMALWYAVLGLGDAYLGWTA